MLQKIILSIIKFIMIFLNNNSDAILIIKINL